MPNLELRKRTVDVLESAEEQLHLLRLPPLLLDGELLAVVEELERLVATLRLQLEDLDRRTEALLRRN